jgi:lipid-A-disaccharide synthase
MKTMRRIADRVLVIFPFEEQIYRDAGVPVQWVGHPLLDVGVAPEPRDQFLRRQGLDPSRPVVALLPGSRRNELRAILPSLVEAARIIHGAVPAAQFVLARAPHLPDELLAPVNKPPAPGPPSGVPDPRPPAPHVSIIGGAADDVLASADVALVASGTVTVQAALHECPMVVVYRLSPLTYRLGRPFVQVDTFAMANLVAGRRVVAELIQDDFTPERVAEEALRLLRDPQEAERVRAELRTVRAKLGEPGASRRAAEAVIDAAGGVDS